MEKYFFLLLSLLVNILWYIKEGMFGNNMIPLPDKDSELLPTWTGMV